MAISFPFLFDMLITGLIIGGIYALVGVTLNFQYGLMRILNIAHGEFIMLSAFSTYWLFRLYDVNPIMAMAITGPMLFVIGLILHKVIFERLVRTSPSTDILEANSLLVAFGLLFIIQGATVLSWGADIRGISFLATSISPLGIAIPLNRLLAVIMAVIICVSFYYFLRLSLVGKAVRALMQDQEGAALIGVRVHRIHRYFFALSLALTGAAGSLIAPLFEIHPFIGMPYTIVALIVIVLSGAGSVVGSMVAGLIIGVAETFGMYLTSPLLRTAIAYIIFIIILLVRPTGIMRYR